MAASNFLEIDGDGEYFKRVPLPPDDADYSTLMDWLTGVAGAELIFCKGKAYANWLKGQALLIAKRALKSGEYQMLILKFEIKPATEHACKKVAEHISEDVARKVGTKYTDMLCALGWKSYQRPGDAFDPSGDPAAADDDDDENVDDASDDAAPTPPPKPKTWAFGNTVERLKKMRTELADLPTELPPVKLETEAAIRFYRSGKDELDGIVTNADSAIQELLRRIATLERRPTNAFEVARGEGSGEDDAADS